MSDVLSFKIPYVSWYSISFFLLNVALFLKTRLRFNKNAIVFQIKHSCVLNKTQLCFKNFSFVSTSFRHTPQGHPELTYKLQSPISGKKPYFARKEEYKRLTLCVKAALRRAQPSVTHFFASHRPSRSASRLTI